MVLDEMLARWEIRRVPPSHVVARRVEQVMRKEEVEGAGLVSGEITKAVLILMIDGMSALSDRSSARRWKMLVWSAGM